MGLSKGEHFQNGFTRTTLCESCNGKCGKHHVSHFADWTAQAAAYHSRISGRGSICLPFCVHSLALIKQLAVMALAMSPVESIDLPHFEDLRRFAMSPNRRGGIDAFRFYSYFHSGPAVLQSLFYALKFDGGPGHLVHSIVGREPLGYVVTFNDADSARWAKGLNLCDLSSFAHRTWDHKHWVHLRLPHLRGGIPFRPNKRDKMR